MTDNNPPNNLTPTKPAVPSTMQKPPRKEKWQPNNRRLTCSVMLGTNMRSWPVNSMTKLETELTPVLMVKKWKTGTEKWYDCD